MTQPADASDGEAIFEDRTSVVRQYSVTGGRARNARWDVIARVAAAQSQPPPNVAGALNPEQIALLEVCRTPHVVVDIASRLNLSLNVVHVLLDDLHKLGLITVADPNGGDGAPEEGLLDAVLDGLKEL